MASIAYDYSAQIAAWQNWFTQATGTTTTANWTVSRNPSAAVWEFWNTTASTTTAQFVVSDQALRQMQAMGRSPETAEERQLRVEREERQRLEHLARIEAETRRSQEAQRRAEALLHDNLSDEQLAQVKAVSRFRVRGNKGGVYDVCVGSGARLIQGDRTTHSICIHARERIPAEDNALALKLLIETDEDEFRRIGNFSRV